MVLLAFALTGPWALFGQDTTAPQEEELNWDELYNDPGSVNKLFVGFQPIYGELFKTNVNAGFGIESWYVVKNKATLHTSFRMPYHSYFFDFARNNAKRNSNVDNKPGVFNHIELGGTWHFRDFQTDDSVKMMVFDKTPNRRDLAAHEGRHIVIPAKLRKIYGGRLGAVIWSSTTDINQAMEQQGLVHGDLTNSSGAGLPADYVNSTGELQPLSVFSNISSAGLYLGGSMTWIRNVAITVEDHDSSVDDLLLTTFFDLLLSPYLALDDIEYGGDVYSTQALALKKFGFRAGVEGRFNRTWSWAYGAELGYRPSLENRGFFILAKIGFPVYGTNLKKKVPALTD
jgi:hypothetical protein